MYNEISICIDKVIQSFKNENEQNVAQFCTTFIVNFMSFTVKIRVFYYLLIT